MQFLFFLLFVIFVSTSSAFEFVLDNGFFTSKSGWVIPFKTRVLFDANNAEYETEKFIREHSKWFGNLDNLALGASRIHRMGNHIFLLRELYFNGIRIWEGDYEFRLFDSGDYLELWGVRGRFCPAEFISERFITESGLRKILQERFGNLISLESIDSLYYYAYGNYWLSFFVICKVSSTERYAVFVDRKYGRILYYVNTVVTYPVSGQATIKYYPERPSDGFSEAPFRNGFLSVNYLYVDTTDNYGNYYINVPSNMPNQPLRARLTGQYVYVEYAPGPDAIYLYFINPPAIHNWGWDETIAHPDEMNLYYHTDFVHSWYKALDPSFTRMDYSVPARAQVSDMTDNAYWDGYGTNYGAIGPLMLCNNFALFSDVVYHEYSHGVTQYIYDGIRLPYEGQSGAMNEAWSDYFSCSINNDPLHGEGICGGAFRNLENNLRFPDDTIGEPHFDGAILSAALWAIRSRIHPRHADSLAHFARYGHATNFFDYFMDYLYTDDNDGNLSTGTPHFNIIMNSFARHGIGPGFYPQIVLLDWSFNDSAHGDCDMIPENGETLAIKLVIYHKEDFPYPIARSVSLTARSLEPSSGVVLNWLALGDIEPGDTVYAEPLLFVVNDYAYPHFVDIAIDIHAENAERTVREFIRVPLGKTRLILVDDDGGGDIEKFYISALESIQTLYAYWDIERKGEIPFDSLQNYELVLWFTGDNTLPLSGSSINSLTHYLDNRGSLILTGQYIGERITGTHFMLNYLRAIHTHNRVANYLVEGVSDFPLFNNTRLAILGFPGAGNQVSQSGVEGVDGATVIFRYVPSSIGAATFYRNEYTAFYFGFGLESISGAGNTLGLDKVLVRLLNYFDIQTCIHKADHQNIGLQLVGPYPNPFNSYARFTVHINRPGDYDLSLLNIAGKSVGRIYRGFIDGEKSFILDASRLSSGIYFISVSGPESINKRFIILK